MVAIKTLGNCSIQTATRETTSFLIEIEGKRVLIDCGPGAVRQLRALGHAVNDVDVVIVTHSHVDHACGYPYFAWSKNAEAYFGTTVKPQLDVVATQETHGVLSSCLEAMAPSASLPTFRVNTLTASSMQNTVFMYHEITVTTVPMDHAVPTLGVILQAGNHKIAYSSDTLPNAAFADAARGADVLIHQAFSSSAFEKMAAATKSSTSAQAAQVATMAGARRLLLAHTIEPEHEDPTRLLAEAREHFSGAIELPTDLQVFTL